MGKAFPIPTGGSIARISFSVWLRPKIKKLINEEKFDILHLHEPMAGALTMNMLAISSENSVKKIGTFHTFGGTKLYRIGAKRIAQRYFKNLDGRIAVSIPAYEFINKYLPADYEIIPNGIDYQLFNNAKPFDNLLDGKINLLFVGRLEKRKGLKYLLAAYSKLKWEWPNLRLLVVGPGKLDIDSIRIISERNLKDIIFVGSVSDNDKARYYKSADIYSSPATGKESFGIVLLEAMASGIPVVGTAVGGQKSFFKDGQNCLVYEKENADKLAKCLISLNNYQLYHKLVDCALKQIQEKFDFDHYCQRIEKKLLQVAWKNAS